MIIDNIRVMCDYVTKGFYVRIKYTLLYVPTNE